MSPQQILCAAATVASNTLVKVAIAQQRPEGDGASKLRYIWSLAQSPHIWLAGVLFIAANILWWMILAQKNISSAMPIQIALVLSMSSAFGWAILGEQASARSIIGCALILAGAFLINNS